MATVSIVKNAERVSTLESKQAEGKSTLSGGGLTLQEGKHSFKVADKKAFGILEVVRKADGKEFALPIVAGELNMNGVKIITEISEKAGAKTLVVPDAIYVQLKPNTEYILEVGPINNRMSVLNAVPADATVSTEEED